MIRREDIVKIGQFNKPHGIKGEMSFTFTNDSFDESECRFLICEIDGIFVPFVIESYRFKSGVTALIKLKGIDSEIKARILINQPVYFPKKFISEEIEEDFTWDYFLDYTLVNVQGSFSGLIVDVDDSTINTLFVVEREGKEFLIPAAEEMILGIDHEEKKITVQLPDGLIDL